jgi:hypothetical protein
MENRKNENRNENIETNNADKKGKKKGFLKKVLIAVLVLALLSPVIGVLRFVFVGASALKTIATREWFTIVEYVDESTVVISDENGVTFDVRLVGIVMNDETTLEPYIGEKVYLRNRDGIEVDEVVGDVPAMYLVMDNHHIIQGEMLAAGTASMTDEVHPYYTGFDNSAWFGEYRI